ncbi:hypothetical protein, partial [Herbiconiux daphne]|nr:hypothetical protein [Herbiconiux daphne]
SIMAKKWNEVQASPEFQALSAPEKAAAQAQYFDEVVKPQVPADEVDAAHNEFYSQNPVSQPAAPEPAPQTPQEAPQQPQELSAGEVVGEGLASAGRVTAGGLAGIANAGVSAVNAAKSFGAWAGQKLGLGDGTYTPMAPAGYGDLDQYLMPKTTAEKVGADVITYAAGGKIAAPE